MSDLTDRTFARDDEILIAMTFFDCLRAVSDGDHERMAQSIAELAAWGISIEIAGSDKH
ncbi:MAG: hypothetical protein ACI8P0_006324 [Planctomycetaceae bacterium]|jgi:hypothetical protein